MNNNHRQTNKHTDTHTLSHTQTHTLKLILKIAGTRNRQEINPIDVRSSEVKISKLIKVGNERMGKVPRILFVHIS